MKAGVIQQLKDLAEDRKSFFNEDGDDEIFRADYEALMYAIESLKKDAVTRKNTAYPEPLLTKKENTGDYAMIKNFMPQQYDGTNPLPIYVSNTRAYTLAATVREDYEITLAKLTVGESVSAGKSLSHALFESFTDHGKRMKAARTRVSGCDRDFIAVKSAMIETGIEFYPVLSCACETILCLLGEWFMAQNPEITAFTLVSQTCH